METGSFHSGSGGSYTVSCASDHDESTFLKKNRHLGWIQLGVSIICLSCALAAVGCEAVPYQHYRSTSAFEEAGLALWPLNFDLQPTIAILSCGCVIALQNLVYIIAALLPSPHSHIRRLNILASGTAFAGLLAATIGLAFSIYLPRSTYPDGFSQNETLHSWTCKWKALGSVTSSEDADVHAPTHFARDCRETQAAFVILALLVGLEVVRGVVALAALWLDRSVVKQREDSAQLEKIRIAVRKVNGV
ncbi:uncharacterized protein ACLA_018890 [Aspergillus clavatus NRRL 1]|uniref:Uncharacterized protein n=1 Tax=Aspergillus clavatus (strain ATCC 1007 / CBS 513.65 / DSM 816 / NCTC 3887 / NRRL 1 / QM 1276 / 107) TaxID=344612 RepID=A1CNG4_ASPCL|nr:uncharacterized protein ACLA_018890 [Aspergillus clavatus NRRL 1]EAW07185.1 conserved hypothetical protein [Aspergillus clavatus NRRL 1]